MDGTSASRMGSGLGRWLLALVSSVLILANLSAPAHAAALVRVPANGATVSTVPVLTWPEMPQMLAYQVQVSSASSFATVSFDETVVSNTATPTLDSPTGTSFWRYRGIGLDGVPASWSPVWSFDRDAAQGPDLVSPASGVKLAYPAQIPTIRWEPLAGVSQYEVSIADNAAFVGAVTKSTAATTFTPSDLLTSDGTKTYFWRVRGQSSSSPAVKTQWSDTRSFSIVWASAAKPNPVSPAQAEVTKYPSFSWTSVAGASTYELWVATGESFASPTKFIVPATAYTPTNELAPQAHWWKVRGLDANGSPTDWSDARYFTVRWLDSLHADEPARPDNLVVTGAKGPASACADIGSGDACMPYETPLNEFRVSWEPVATASHYEVELNLSSAFQYTKEPERVVCEVPRPFFTAYNKRSVSVRSTNMDRCEISGSGFTTYIRVRAVTVATDGKTYTSPWSDVPRAGETRTGLVPMVTLVGNNEAGAIGTPVQPATPVSPATGSVSSDVPLLSWAPVPGAQWYRVFINTHPEFVKGTHVGETVDENNPYFVTRHTSFAPATVLPDNNAGESYYWFVLPCVTVGAEVKCQADEASAIVDPAYTWSFRKVAKAPVPLRTDVLEDEPVAPRRRSADASHIRASWQQQLLADPAGAGTKYYEIDLGAGVLDGKADYKTDATSVVFSAAALTPGSEYQWRVRAIDSVGGPTAWSAPTTFVAPQASGPVITSTPATVVNPTLAWLPDSGTDSYELEVFRGTSSGFPSASRVLTASTGYPVMTIPTWLAPGTYSWRVRSVDALGRQSAWTTSMNGGVASFTVAFPAPALAQPAASAVVKAADLVFDWAAVPQAVKYRIEISLNGSTVEAADLVGTKFSPTAALKAGTYQWRVSSLTGVDAKTVAAQSDWRNLTVVTVPGAPAAAKATAENAGITFRWTAPADGGSPIIGYQMRYRTGEAGWTVTNHAADVNAITLAGLAQSTVYSFEVSASSAVGQGPWTRTVTAATATVPGTPSNFLVTPSGSGFKVTWAAPSANGGSPITGYIVSHRKVGSADWTAVTVPSSPGLVEGLAANAAYELRIAAVNAVGQGAFTAAVTATTPAPVSAPSVKATVREPGRIAVTWVKPAASAANPIKGFQVTWRRTGTTTWQTVSASAYATSISISPVSSSALVRGTLYDVRVAAVTASGVGPATLVRAKTANVPSKVASVKVSSSGGLVKVVWAIPANGGLAISKFSVYSSAKATTGYKLVRTTTATAKSTSFRAVKGKTIYIKVNATNRVGTGAFSTYIKVRVR